MNAKKLFVVGTGTDVGKTYVTALLVKKLHHSGRRAAYYKAAMSGNARGGDGMLIPGDAAWVKRVSGIGQPLADMCPFVYEAAVSPHLASRIEGNPVEMRAVMAGYEKVAAAYDFVSLEGSGGILCPLHTGEKELWLEDVIRAVAAPCLLVADSRLGSINRVALTAYYMAEKNIPIEGIIWNQVKDGDRMEEDNIAMCEQITGLKTLARVHDGDSELQMDAGRLASLYG